MAPSTHQLNSRAKFEHNLSHSRLSPPTTTRCLLNHPKKSKFSLFLTFFPPFCLNLPLTVMAALLMHLSQCLLGPRTHSRSHCPLVHIRGTQIHGKSVPLVNYKFNTQTEGIFLWKKTFKIKQSIKIKK